MNQSKKTTGTVVFQAAGDNGVLQTIYLKKGGLSQKHPTKIRVTVEDISDE
tara:strand:- start:116 stop:268 length:153 start_codon:yes stop_codon:yes gene_type:complete